MSSPTYSEFPLTLEQVFMEPGLWNVPTATAVQRAKCRLIEGLPLEELAEDPHVIEMCGGKVPVSTKRPTELLDISATRIGKSLFAAASLFWMSQTVDLSRTRESDIVRIFVVALKIGGTSAVIKHLIEPLMNQPALRPYLVDDPRDISIGSVQRAGLRIRRPHDGRIVEVVCIPLDKGGGSALSVYCAGLVCDEYPRMAGADDGVKNVTHFRDGVQSRMLPGAIAIYTGSPWQAYGPAYENSVKHWGNPIVAPDGRINLLVLRTSAVSFIGVGEWDEEKRAMMERLNPVAYTTDYLAKFLEGDQAVFPGPAIDHAFTRPRDSAVEWGRPAIFADPSALRRDYWAAMVGAWAWKIPGDEDLYEVEELGETLQQLPVNGFRPGRIISGRKGWVRVLEDRYGRPIPKRQPATDTKPFFKVFRIVSWDKGDLKRGARGLDLVKAVGQLGREYGCEDFHFDGYEQLMLGDMIRREGLRPMIHAWSGGGGNARKTAAVDHLRTLFVDHRIELPPNEPASPVLKTELQRFRARATQGGSFSYEVATGIGHGDHASCLTLASRVDLDGFLDRSPTLGGAERHEEFDNEQENLAAA